MATQRAVRRAQIERNSVTGAPPMPATYPGNRWDAENAKGPLNMFAVIKSGGRQYKVAVGERLEVNRLPVEAGDQVSFEVLLISDAGKTQVGSPLVKDAAVLATAIQQGRGEKLIVFKYKSKK